MKSIYLELLGLADQQLEFSAINFGGIYDGDEDEYDEPEDNADSNLIFLPLERTFLRIGDEEVDVEDVQFSYVNFTFKDESLKKYDDGDLYKEFPIAVSFLMDRGDYMRHLRGLSSEDLSLVSYSNGACHSYEDGIEVMDISAGSSVRIIMGFAKEGVPRGPREDS